MDSQPKPQTALEIIYEWSKDKPIWIRDALKRIVASGMPDTNAIGELVEICMTNYGLGDVKSARPLEKTDIEIAAGHEQTVVLCSICDAEGVNQLAPKQTVKFGTSGLTVIYGQNGSGKSGYTRILKRACNARHRGEIMPDAFSEATGKPAAAKIYFKQGEKEDFVDWTDDEKRPHELTAITIFDRDCASILLNQKNPVLFRPFGLDIPDDLATVCVEVKALLEDKKTTTEQIRDPIFNNPIWSSSSDIGQYMASLSHGSKINGFPDYPNLSADEIRRLAQLQRDLSTDPAIVAESYRKNSVRILRLAETIRGLAKQFGDDAVSEFEAVSLKAAETRRTAKVAAEKAFSGLELSGVGEAVWRNLWEAARRYSESQIDPPRTYPIIEGEPCVLCHQPVSNDAAKRMGGFEAFIRDDTEILAEQAELELSQRVELLREQRIEIRSLSIELNILHEKNSPIAQIVRRFLAGLRLRRAQLVKSASTSEARIMPTLPEAPFKALQQVASDLDAYADGLTANADARKKLVAEYNQLNDRNQSSRLRGIAISEIERLKNLQALSSCIGECATNSVTRLGNDIADKTVTPAMRDRFQSEIVKLAADRVRVEIIRSGGKAGSPLYEVKFFANRKAKVANVLSEGEQTCVALAAHLTELTNEKSGSALVFDDPVNSLDHRWRRKVAERLVDEAANRQVIVFTHDLIFVNDLDDLASQAGVSRHLGTLTRSSEGCGVYSDNLPWRAARVKERVDQMEKDARAAKSLYDADDEEPYRLAVIKLYGELRAAWERSLEDRVFAGVIMRHRDYINTKNLKRVAALDVTSVAVFEKNFKRCCDFLDAHDPSRGRDGEVPPPNDVTSDIKALLDWDDSLRRKQNDIEKTQSGVQEPKIRVVQ